EITYSTFVPVIARDFLRVGSGGLGILLAVSGAGAVGAAFFVATFRASARWFPWLLTISLGFGGAIFLFALSPWFALSLALALATGFMSQSFFTTSQTLIQVLAPDAYRGRIASMRTLVLGVSPVGQFLVGATAERTGTPAALAAAGFLCATLMTTLTLLARPLRRL